MRGDGAGNPDRGGLESECVPQREALRELAAAGAAHCDFGGKALRDKKPNGTGGTRVADSLCMAAVSLCSVRSRRSGRRSAA